jgi:hypothetical protein
MIAVCDEKLTATLRRSGDNLAGRDAPLIAASKFVSNLHSWCSFVRKCCGSARTAAHKIDRRIFD